PEVLAKISLAHEWGMVVDGHSPGLSGKRLTAYAASGVKTDHECSTVEELEERIERGMYVHIREGSAVRNLSALLKGVTPANMRRCLFCTDDREPEDIARRGHINSMLRQAVEEGIEPTAAITMATLNPAECYGLRAKGALAPGYDADILVVEDLKSFKVRDVYTAGHHVSSKGNIAPSVLPDIQSGIKNSVRLGKLEQESFSLKLSTNKANVISIVPSSIVTTKTVRKVVADGEGLFKVENNPELTKAAVVERHKGTGNIGLGLLENYGIRNGAIGTTIAHDAHNIVVAGDNDGDMFAVVKELERIGGGIVLCRECKVVDSLELPIGGLMCESTAAEVGEQLQRLLRLAYEEFSVNPAIQPFMTLSFMSLSVIPKLKLTDQGLLDVTTFSLIDLCVDE
ncbi:MAG: adenine deaminase, partial [Gammaproteobacteria bacterium]|nr:adenine deaminase [Gammaproteobacteria bacterium]